MSIEEAYLFFHTSREKQALNINPSLSSLQYIPTMAMMKRDSVVALTFLQWFKLFFIRNGNGKEYDAFKARGGQSLVPADSGESSVCQWINHTVVTQISCTVKVWLIEMYNSCLFVTLT